MGSVTDFVEVDEVFSRPVHVAASFAGFEPTKANEAAAFQEHEGEASPGHIPQSRDVIDHELLLCLKLGLVHVDNTVSTVVDDVELAGDELQVFFSGSADLDQAREHKATCDDPDESNAPAAKNRDKWGSDDSTAEEAE